LVWKVLRRLRKQGDDTEVGIEVRGVFLRRSAAATWDRLNNNWTTTMVVFVYCLTIFVSSLLLFAIQPMVGRMLLPSLGGTPAVWNTCVVFFQAMLLLGYGYAFLSSKFLKPRVQIIVHWLLLSLVFVFLPIQLRDPNPPAESDPTIWLIVQLMVMIGLPFFVVSSHAPLIQNWFSKAAGRRGNDPYFLYAFSNCGSFAALLAYPFAFERMFGLSQQSVLWLIGYAILLAGMLACGLLAWRGISTERETPALENAKVVETANIDAANDDATGQGLGWPRRFRFIILAAVPSSLMLGVTTYITTDVGSVPLLWIIPLALYLLTFVLAFSNKQILPHRWMVRAAPFLLLLMVALLLVDLGKSPLLIGCAHLLTFFVVAMVCHGEMARLRPPVEHLTEFYFLMSLGGVAGGAFNALLAPHLFNDIFEYPLMLVAACLLLPPKQVVAGVQESANRLVPKFSWQDLAWPLGFLVWVLACVGITAAVGIDNKIVNAILLFAIPALVCFSLIGRPFRFGACFAVLIFASAHFLLESEIIHKERGFFGVNKVSVDEKNGFRLLINGRTIHGIQPLYDSQSPVSYYHRTGPIGDIFERAAAAENCRVGVVGLGTGTIASYSKPGQVFEFYEIDPVVLAFASNCEYFDYLDKARGDVKVILGDARIQLQKKLKDGSAAYDVIIIDAFSSDSVPSHLITREAVELYFKMLRDDGILAIHITNKYLDFRPLIVALARESGLVAAMREDKCAGDHTDNQGKLSSTWVVLSRSDETLELFQESGDWGPIECGKQMRVWTDDFSNLLDVLIW
jgi:hypothetical protein